MTEAISMAKTAERYALYFAPVAGDPLWAFGCGVLGRDAISGATTEIVPELVQAFPQWRQAVDAAAHYGFHATLKAPFELAAGVDLETLRADLAATCAALPPVQLGILKVAQLNRFVALVPVEPPAALGDLAALLVRGLDHWRAPLTPEDRARRSPDRLSPRQREYLDRWGYPYVLEEFQFHMTLTGPTAPGDLAVAAEILAELYRPVRADVTIRDVCIFKQRSRTAPFLLVHRQALGPPLAS
jgi:putative phosphonate metabolism protein